MIQKYCFVTKVILSLTLISTNLLNAQIFKIKDSSVIASSNLGKVELLHDEDGFHILQDNKYHDVESYWVDPFLRNISNKRLESFLDNGYVTINQMNSGEFFLRANVRGLGGGPISGAIAYWTTKTLCYGTAVAAASTVVVATGGMAGAVTGALAAGSTAGASLGATVVGSAIAGAGLGADAALATAGVVTSAGGIAGAVAAVESASTAAGFFFTMIPFLP